MDTLDKNLVLVCYHCDSVLIGVECFDCGLPYGVMTMAAWEDRSGTTFALKGCE